MFGEKMKAALNWRVIRLMLSDLSFPLTRPPSRLKLSPMITLTSQAAVRIREMSEELGDASKKLRIFVEPGGCSGFEYGMSFDAPKDGDTLQESHGVSFAVDQDSLTYLAGSEVHFDDGLSGKGFEIRNPNAQNTCGCGKSFS